MLRFTFLASLLIQLLYFSTIARGSEETQNVRNITPSAATKSDAVSDLNDKIESVSENNEDSSLFSISHNANTVTRTYNASAADETTKTLISEPSSGEPLVTTAAVEVTNSPAESTLAETWSVETETATTKVVDELPQITTQTNTTASISSNSTDSNNECTIRVGFFWWKKVKIPVKRAYMNARKCELQYCTPSLKIESFTCKNLLALTVPPDSTEDLMNEWKLECTKHQCIPAN